MKRIFGAVVGVLALASAAQAEDSVSTPPFYDAWFTGIVSVAETGITALGASWTVPETADSVSYDATNTRVELNLDTDESVTLETANAPDTNTVTVIETQMLAYPLKTNPTKSSPFSDTDIGAALASYDNKYYLYNGSVWTNLYGATPDANNLASFRFSINSQMANSQTAAVTIKVEVKDNDAWNVLRTDEDDTSTTNITLAGSNKLASLSSVVCRGAGILAKLDGTVMRGLASANGIKYGTVAEAVDAALGSASKTVTILRENSETISTDDSNLVVDDPGNVYSGTVENNGSKPMLIYMPTNIVALGNGERVLNISVGSDVNVASKFKIQSSDSTKSVTLSKNDNGKLVVTVQTAESVIKDIEFGSGTTISTVSGKFRKFMEDNIDTVYNGADSTASKLKAALDAKGENNIEKWKSYALGIGTSTSLKIEPVANDTASDGVSLTLPDVTANGGEFTVSYKLQKYGSSGWENTDTDFNSATAIKLPIDSSARYRVVADITPASGSSK